MENVIVIARYQENIDWVKNLRVPCIVYNKGEFLEGAINIPNVGRESETFLRYIISNYNNLPNKVTFLQGNPFYHFKNTIDYINQYKGNDELVYLSDFIPTDNIKGEPNHKGLPIKKVLKDLGLDDSDRMFEFCAGAQYIVPKSLILNKSLKWWKLAYEVHQNNPMAPWVFERIWPVIWSYKNS